MFKSIRLFKKNKILLYWGFFESHKNQEFCVCLRSVVHQVFASQHNLVNDSM